mgnify:CR=1 FL=1
MIEPLSLDEFLDEKRDYSPLLVHLTRDGIDAFGDPCVSAKEVLECILDEKTLKAFNYYCLFNSDLESQSSSSQDLFKVACFTETPIDQINVLLMEVNGRNFKPKPYGLVFKKDYIRQQEGNPVFYVAGSLFDSLWRLYNDAKERSFSSRDNKVLALVNKCDEEIDFHWEREWRIVGDLKFRLNDIYCGLCPEEDISYFKNKYSPVVFISPSWGISKILDKLVGR